MGFSDLPIEILYGIADHLGFERDINALVRTSKRSYSALNRYLYRHHVKEWDAENFESVCKSGLLNPMRMFLNEGTSLDTRDYGFSSIAVAAAYGNEDIVKCLLERGVDPNVKRVLSESWVDLLPDSPVDDGHDGQTGPYDLAMENGHEGTVRLLVPHIKSVDCFTKVVITEYGRTLSNLAVGSGNLNLVRMLVEELKCKVDPPLFLRDGRTTSREMTPLALAAFLGHTDIARYLISSGADLNAVSGNSCSTVLAYAVKGNHLETAKALIEHGSIPDPLIEIQQARNALWHEENENIYSRAFEAVTIPLTDAAFRGNHEMLRLLFQYIDLERIHRDVHVEDANFLVLLAAACGLDNIIQRLLDKSCDVNTHILIRFDHRRLNTCNGLFFASRFGHTGVARILLDHGADPDPWDPTRTRIPLVEAVSAGHQQMAELLLDAGANPNALDISCKPVLLLAVQSEPMFRMLLNRGAGPSTVKKNPWRRRLFLQQALESQDASITRLGLSIVEDRVSPKYITQLVAEAGTTTTAFEITMQYLWHHHGVKPSPRRKDSYAALESAIKRQNAEVAEILLLRHGLRLPREKMADYLAWAASGRDRNSSEATLDVLLQRHGTKTNANANADIINTTRSDGHTCLTLLIQQKKIQGMNLVIDRGANYPLTFADPETGKNLLSVAMDRLNTFTVPSLHAHALEFETVLELLLQLLETTCAREGIASKSEKEEVMVETHLRQAQTNIYLLADVDLPISDNYDKLKRVRLERLLEYFRCRRRYPVPVRAGAGGRLAIMG